MQKIHITAETDAYRELLRRLEIRGSNNVDSYDMDDSKRITIGGKRFEVKGDVDGNTIYRVKRFHLSGKSGKAKIWLGPWTPPSYFWLTQDP